MDLIKVEQEKKGECVGSLGNGQYVDDTYME